MSTAASHAIFVALLVLLSSRAAAAQDAGVSVNGCVETIPKDATRPILTETFPDRGLSGYARELVLKVEHGKGESLKPLDPATSAVALLVKDLRAAGFVLPHQDGGAGARIEEPISVSGTEGRVVSTMSLPLLVLPPGPGRNFLTLPSLPVTVLRANGVAVTLCTKAHRMRVEDPIAEEPNPKPKENPGPLPEYEEWTDLKNAVFIGLLALLGALILFALFRKVGKREKVLPPPPPPRPPWEIALESLDALRFSGALDDGRYDHFVDRVNDTLRAYLGARYGFDGLESTTDEILVALRTRLPEDKREAVETLLRETDLFKFANLRPTKDECVKSLEIGETIVRKTMPGTLGRESANGDTAVREARGGASSVRPPSPSLTEEETKFGPKEEDPP